MRPPSSQLPPEIDHPEERLQHLKVDDSLFEVIANRLDSVMAHLSAIPMDDAVSGVRRHVDTIATRIRSAKATIETFYRSGPFDRNKHNQFHDITLSLADRAESAAQRFEEPGGRTQILTTIEEDLTRLEKVLDECSMIS